MKHVWGTWKIHTKFVSVDSVLGLLDHVVGDVADVLSETSVTSPTITLCKIPRTETASTINNWVNLKSVKYWILVTEHVRKVSFARPSHISDDAIKIDYKWWYICLPLGFIS
jgi:hypothetical protein